MSRDEDSRDQSVEVLEAILDTALVAPGVLGVCRKAVLSRHAIQRHAPSFETISPQHW